MELKVLTKFVSKLEIQNALDRLGRQEFQSVVRNIKPGQFKRNAPGKDYSDRLTYTRELRKFMYNPSVLEVIFGDKELKLLFFRTFGYSHSTDFTIYPNCWLRDLTLLNIGEGTYLADGILLGTNQVSTDQAVLRVGPIVIGKRCVFDQQCLVGYNSQIGDDCIVGIRVAIGLKCIMGDRVKIGEACTIRHGNRFGDDVVLGAETRVGNFCLFDDGVEVPEFSDVPSFSHVTKEGIFHRKPIRKRA